MSPYALHKLVGEQYCALYAKLYGMETMSLRYFNAYGPKQHAGDPYMTVICKFSDLILRGETPTINGDGTHTRDFTYITDIVDANLAAMNTEKKEVFGGVFNVGAGNQIVLNDVVNKILEITKSTIVPKHGPEVIEPKATFADVSKAKRILGWEPKVNFEEGIQKTMDYYLKYYGVKTQ
jgi:nucleoside-diphosphate-sugar epimerase